MKVEIKSHKHLLAEYGLVLRWINGDDRGGWLYYLEDVEKRETILIENQEAIDFIKSKTLNPFRSHLQSYYVHQELFKILGIKSKVEELFEGKSTKMKVMNL